jgi:hypothetical protein
LTVLISPLASHRLRVRKQTPRVLAATFGFTYLAIAKL